MTQVVELLQYLLEERGSEYILPVRIDDTAIPGLPSTIGYLQVSAGVYTIVDLLIQKLAANAIRTGEI